MIKMYVKEETESHKQQRPVVLGGKRSFISVYSKPISYFSMYLQKLNTRLKLNTSQMAKKKKKLKNWNENDGE